MSYPHSKLDPTGITNKLVQAIYAIPNVEDHSNTQWTEHIRTILKQLAPPNHKCHFSETRVGRQEFLVDIVWWKIENGRESMALAAESEWGNPWIRGKYLPSHQALEVGRDFGKLLVLKSPIKLMIFASDEDETRKAIFKEIARYFDQYEDHIAGERYVFIDLAQFSRRTAFIFEVTDRDRPLLENLTLVSSI
jgi:hypothetical protein